tara:strand:+ start:138 stop:686 length:549 start_codon:yes stop_codon:yes gene_type:complete
MNKLVLVGITVIMFFLKNSSSANYEKIFYDFKINNNAGEIINLNDYKGKVVLLVNTASYCGFTKQYNDLQELWIKYKSRGLIVLAIPSNSFNQEKNNDDEVKKFCEINFNINFPISTITDVKGDGAHEIYKWAKKNYGNSAVPKWNFHKILINKNGKIEETYASFTNPTSKKIINKIEQLLN